MFRNCLFLLKNMLSKLIHATVGMSKLGYTSLLFVDPGVKVNGAYYRNVLLLQVTTVATNHTSGVRRVLHLSAGQCAATQGT